jgi:hypothetical protein
MTDLKILVLAVSAAGVLAPCAALADVAAASACATKLSPHAKLVYDAVAPDLHQGDDLRATIKSHTRQLVIDGKMERAIAHDSAVEAAACLKQLPH